MYTKQAGRRRAQLLLIDVPRPPTPALPVLPRPRALHRRSYCILCRRVFVCVALLMLSVNRHRQCSFVRAVAMRPSSPPVVHPQHSPPVSPAPVCTSRPWHRRTGWRGELFRIHQSSIIPLCSAAPPVPTLVYLLGCSHMTQHNTTRLYSSRLISLIWKIKT